VQSSVFDFQDAMGALFVGLGFVSNARPELVDLQAQDCSRDDKDMIVEYLVSPSCIEPSVNLRSSNTQDLKRNPPGYMH
jgi:hypothetical protein